MRIESRRPAIAENYQPPKDIYTPEKSLQLRGDLLTLDASALSPEQSTGLHEIVKFMASDHVNRYGPFLQKNQLNRLAGIEHRVLVTTRNNYEQFYNLYPYGEKPTYDQTVSSIGTYKSIGSIMAVDGNRGFYINASNEDVAIPKKGKSFLWRNGVPNTIGHEIAHHFSNSREYRGNMKLFYEAGADFYGAEMKKRAEQRLRKKHEGLGYGISRLIKVFIEELPNYERVDANSNLYQWLITNFGNDTHRFFAGTLHSYSQKNKIMNVFNDTLIGKYKHLFPPGYFDNKK